MKSPVELEPPLADFEDLCKEILRAMDTEGKKRAKKRCSDGSSRLQDIWEGYHLLEYANTIRGIKKRNITTPFQKKLDKALKDKGFSGGFIDIQRLPTSGKDTGIQEQKSKNIFEVLANVQNKYIITCIVEYLEFCEKTGRPVEFFIEEQAGHPKYINSTHLKTVIKDIRDYIKNWEARQISIIAPKRVSIIPNESKCQNTWLSPKNEDAIPFFYRDDEIQKLNGFIDISGRVDFKIWALIGPSGSGKTRLVTHWTKNLKNWHVHFLSQKDKRNSKKWLDWSPTQSTLIIVDHMFGFNEVLNDIVESCSESLTFHTRLLILDHAFKEPLEEDSRWWFSDDQLEIDEREDLFYGSAPLNIDGFKGKERVLSKIIQHCAKLDDNDSNVEAGLEYLRATNGAWQPLFAALVGEAIREKREFTEWNRRDLIKYYLDSRTLPWKSQGDDGIWASCFICVATARNGINYNLLKHAGYRKHISPPKDFTSINEICERMTSKNDTEILFPFHPDLLGESFFLLFLEHLYNLRDFPKAFYLMFRLGDKETQYSDSLEFTRFMSRLISNLVNDLKYTLNSPDKNNSERITGFKDVLIKFLNPNNFSKNISMRWAASIALIDIATQCHDLLDDEEIGSITSMADMRRIYKIKGKQHIAQSFVAVANILALNASGKYGIKIDHKELKYFVDCQNENFKYHMLLFLSILGNSHGIDLLLSIGVDINIRDSSGENALMHAVNYNIPHIVNFLLERKLSPDEQNNQGVTALMFACKKKNIYLVKTLLEYKANIRIRNHDGVTALLVASNAGNHETADLLLTSRQGAFAKNDIDNMGRTALMAASYHGHLEVVKVLLNHKANMDMQIKNGATALIIASFKGHTEIAKLLVKNGANKDIKDHEGRTALRWAMNERHISIVQILLSSGAKIEAQREDGVVEEISLLDEHRVQKQILDALRQRISHENRLASAS